LQTQDHVLGIVKSLWLYAAKQKFVLQDEFPGADIKFRYDNARVCFFDDVTLKRIFDDLRSTDYGAAPSLKGKRGRRGSLDAYGMALFSAPIVA